MTDILEIEKRVEVDSVQKVEGFCNKKSTMVGKV
jgi:hypothetical protein